MKLLSRLLPVAIVFVSILLVGTLGYRLIEEWSFFDSLYMAVITVTTVGFGEVQPLSTEGKLFTAVLVLLGVGGITYGFTAVANYIVAGELRGFLEEHRMQKKIDSVSRHFVVCGYGETGRQVCLELKREGRTLVVIDKDEEALKRAEKMGSLVIQGDAGLDSTLGQAGIQKAAGLVAATDDDATNLLVVLSARTLNSRLSIVARANTAEAVDKLHRAGADRALHPYSIAGRRLAQMLIHPEVVDFLDVVTSDESLELILENFSVTEGADLDGQSMDQIQVRARTGVIIVGLKRKGEVIPRLKPSTPFQAGDVVFALGTRDQLDQFGELAGAPE